MSEIDLRVPFKNYDGEKFNGATMVDVLLEILNTTKSAEPVEIYEICTYLRKEGKILIDENKLNFIEVAIKQNQKYDNLIRGQLIVEIKNQFFPKEG